MTPFLYGSSANWVLYRGAFTRKFEESLPDVNNMALETAAVNVPLAFESTQYHALGSISASRCLHQGLPGAWEALPCVVFITLSLDVGVSTTTASSKAAEVEFEPPNAIQVSPIAGRVSGGGCPRKSLWPRDLYPLLCPS